MPRKQRFKPSRKPKPQISELPEAVSSVVDNGPESVEAQTARTSRGDELTSVLEDLDRSST